MWDDACVMTHAIGRLMCAESVRLPVLTTNKLSVGTRGLRQDL